MGINADSFLVHRADDLAALVELLRAASRAKGGVRKTTTSFHAAQATHASEEGMR